MADEQLEERSEEASQHRRDEWRSDGNVAQSRELAAVIVMLATAGVIYATGAIGYRIFGGIFEASFSEAARLGTSDWTAQTVIHLMQGLFKAGLIVLAPVAIASVAVGVLSYVVQFGLVFTSKPIDFDLEKLNPIKGFGRIFSFEGVFEFLKAIVKFAVVGTVAFVVLKKRIYESGGLWDADLHVSTAWLGSKTIQMILIVAFAMLVIAALDFGFQKFRYEQKIKMTKQEAKEERKQQDGNPAIKARIRALQRKTASRRMMEAVKKADVVITNPTHIAVALMFDRETMMAPKVVAKGADFMAEQIKKIARENGIPCVENVPLARAMFKALKIGQLISKDLYNAVAEVLAYVYKLKGRLSL